MTTLSYRDLTDTAAANYERHFVPAIGAPVAHGLLAAADLRPGERVLDVATGTGIVARLAAERVGPTGSVTAIDLAPDMIEVAGATPAPDAPVIDWHVGDACALPLPDDAYDVVLCQMGLMFMPDRAAAVAELRRVVAPGGRVLVVTPGAIQPPLVALERALVEHINPDLGGFVGAVFSLHDADAVGALLRDAGLTDVTASTWTATLQLPPAHEFVWQYINLSPMGPIVAGVPDAAKEAMERAAVDAWPADLVDGGEVAQPMVLATGRG